jgi:hypothetical protein
LTINKRQILRLMTNKSQLSQILLWIQLMATLNSLSKPVMAFGIALLLRKLLKNSEIWLLKEIKVIDK